MKSVLFVAYQSPAGSIWINETFRSAFGMYGEELEPVVLFMGEAVLAVRANCKPEQLGCLPLSITFKYIARYKTKVVAVNEDLERFAIAEDGIEPSWNVTRISESELPDFMHAFDKVVFF
ncbi:MAG TPA: DsrE family protein [Candidatus Deferrimicrobium sp.]|jgi:tRNA 2-thiouridine synthesizing protein C|uniref:Intracellular sulfur oxidation protein n=1 Tax=Candidatus Cryosericum septentrionale TaxID=2290913 RepID=A0A398DNM7_9BACT|nr:DsrE family protein [Candidatus Cryosericum septentrionale]RIE16795.1 intracellular sulfur oxidation protein [Candidatus Cryosericum septentrionale]HZL82438.1 DsrE family protein [Candidatus Deferrimicrobium sp.]